jgi:hypothetical protein
MKFELCREHGKTFLRDPESKREYRRTAVGWAFTSEKKPGFLILIGESRCQMRDPLKRYRYYHFCLAECESEDLEMQFKTLLTWFPVYRVSRVFGNPKDRAVVQSLLNLQKNFKRKLLPTPAPYSRLDDLPLFVRLANAETAPKTKTLYLGDKATLLRGHLADMPESMIGQSAADHPAVMALGYVLAGLAATEAPAVRRSEELKPLDPQCGF